MQIRFNRICQSKRRRNGRPTRSPARSSRCLSLPTGNSFRPHSKLTDSRDIGTRFIFRIYKSIYFGLFAQ